MICKYFLPVCGLSLPSLDDTPSSLPTSSPKPYLGLFLSFFPLTFIYLFSCTRSSCGICSLHCSMWALWLWHMGSLVWIEPRPSELGVCILSHWTTREVLGLLLFWSYSSFSPAHLELQELPLPCFVDSVPSRFSPSQQPRLHPDCGCPGFEGFVLVRRVLPTGPQGESGRVERPPYAKHPLGTRCFAHIIPPHLQTISKDASILSSLQKLVPGFALWVVWLHSMCATHRQHVCLCCPIW